MGEDAPQNARRVQVRHFPFFSSWLSTDAASFFASVTVGFLEPDSTFEASDETEEEVCFLGITHSFLKVSD